MFRFSPEPLSLSVVPGRPFGAPRFDLRFLDTIATRNAIVEVGPAGDFGVTLDDGSFSIASFSGETGRLEGRPEAVSAVRETRRAAREGRLTRRAF